MRKSLSIGPRTTEAEIGAAVAAATRDAMHAAEEGEIAPRTEGLFHQGRSASAYDTGHRFVARSKSGQSLYRISAEQRLQTERLLAPLTKNLDYAAE